MIELKIGQVWRHIKRGTTYIIVSPNALFQAKDSPLDECRCVVYRSSLDWNVYVRPVEEFLDGRFQFVLDAR
jgi:hypothetical protein